MIGLGCSGAFWFLDSTEVAPEITFHHIGKTRSFSPGSFLRNRKGGLQYPLVSFSDVGDILHSTVIPAQAESTVEVGCGEVRTAPTPRDTERTTVVRFLRHRTLRDLGSRATECRRWVLSQAAQRRRLSGRRSVSWGIYAPDPDSCAIDPRLGWRAGKSVMPWIDDNAATHRGGLCFPAEWRSRSGDLRAYRSRIASRFSRRFLHSARASLDLAIVANLRIARAERKPAVCWC